MPEPHCCTRHARRRFIRGPRGSISWLRISTFSQQPMLAHVKHVGHFDKVSTQYVTVRNKNIDIVEVPKKNYNNVPAQLETLLKAETNGRRRKKGPLLSSETLYRLYIKINVQAIRVYIFRTLTVSIILIADFIKVTCYMRSQLLPH